MGKSPLISEYRPTHLYPCGMGRHRSVRDGTVGPSTRPVAIPGDMSEPCQDTAVGLVELPLRIRWTQPRRLYDLEVRRDRALVYEQVLTEGTQSDVRRYVDLNKLIDLWPELVLPDHVRSAWEGWLRSNGYLVPPC